MKLNIFKLSLLVAIIAFAAVAEARKVNNEKKKVLKAKGDPKEAAKKTDPPAPTEYTISILGDIGQFEVFNQNAKTEIKDLAEWFKDDYTTICDAFSSNKDNKTKMMVNFEKLLSVMKANSDKLKTDDAAILGDMIYTEKKMGGDNLANIRKYANKQPEGAKADEIEEWKKLASIKSPHQLLPDKDNASHPDDPNYYYYYDLKKIQNFPDIKNLRERELRLKCGWYYLSNLISNKSLTPDWLTQQLQLINGNHTYDVDYKFEANFVSSHFNPTNKKYEVRLPEEKEFKDRQKTPLTSSQFLQPRVVKANTSLFNIHYIDLDPSLLTCSEYLTEGVTDCKAFKDKEKGENFKKFSECHENRLARKNMPGLDDVNDEAVCNVFIDYHNKVHILLKEIIADQTADWRIARMHQPVFNVEYDYAGMKYNKPLMKKFKLAHIHAWFVSHFHNAQFTVSLYEFDEGEKKTKYNHRAMSKFDSSKVSAVRGGMAFNSSSNQENKVWESLDDFMINAKTNTWVNEVLETKKPDGSLDYRTLSKFNTYVDRSTNTLITNKKEKSKNSVVVAKCNEEFIYQFLTGNSGRVLDPLLNDGYSDLFLVFGQAIFGRHGYTRFRFYKDKTTSNNCLEGEYLILNATGDKFDSVYTQEICQTDVKEVCTDKMSRTTKTTELLALNFKSIDKKNVVLEHLQEVLDPYSSGVKAISDTITPAKAPAAKKLRRNKY